MFQWLSQEVLQKLVSWICKLEVKNRVRKWCLACAIDQLYLHLSFLLVCHYIISPVNVLTFWIFYPFYECSFLYICCILSLWGDLVFLMYAQFYLTEDITQCFKNVLFCLCIVFLLRSFVLLIVVCIFHNRRFPPMCINP